MEEVLEKLKVGNKYGLLKVLELHGRDSGRRKLYKCLCDCGNLHIAESYNLKKGFVKSCGCATNDFLRKKNTKHGMSQTRFYAIWSKVKRKRQGNKSPCYRGIKCDWKSFKKFKEDMYESYLEHIKEYGEKNTSIDRIDNTKGYSKENCRWATPYVQSNNRTTNILLTYDNITKTMMQWSRDLDITYQTIRYRVFKKKMSLEEIVNSI